MSDWTRAADMTAELDLATILAERERRSQTRLAAERVLVRYAGRHDWTDEDLIEMRAALGLPEPAVVTAVAA
jgi:hypothetical protein